MTTEYSPIDVETVAIRLQTVVATLQMVIEGLPQGGEVLDVLGLCRDCLSDQKMELEKIAEGLKEPAKKPDAS